MRAFVDESGTPSISDRETKPYFVVGCVLAEEPWALERMVRRFRADRGWSPYREIKFRTSSQSNRCAFLEKLVDEDVLVRGLIIPKSAIVADFHTIKPSLYHHGIASCLNYALTERVCEHAMIDNYLNSKTANRQLKSYLRQRVNDPVRRADDFSVGNSATVDSLQVADMVAGAIARAYVEADTTYADILRPVLEELIWSENANDLQAPGAPHVNSEDF